MKIFSLLFFAAFLYTGVHAQTWQDTVARIEAAFARYKPDGPGAQMAISRNGQVIFSKAWGLADMEHQVKLTTTSLIEAGSVSKQFTAAAILLLEQEGKLSLSDDVHKYIPELPDYGTLITIRHLMQHTSGLKDWGSVAALSGWPRGTKAYDNLDALAIICRQKTLNNVPGAEYIYSNTGYTLMAIIVQRVSGKELKDFSRPALFDPAGMRQSIWRSSYKLMVPGRAMAYSTIGPRFLNDMPNESVYGHGGLLSTAEELLQWTQFYTGGKLGNPSLFPKQVATHPLNNGQPHNYAAGLVVTQLNGKDVIMHSGATASYRANLEYFPGLGLTFAFLSNTSAFDRDSTNPAALTRNIFIPEPKAGKPQTAVPPLAVAEETLRNYTGWYQFSRDGRGLKLSIKNGQLYAGNNTALFPLGKNRFKNERGGVYEFGEGSFSEITPEKDTLQYRAVDFANINNDGAAARYAGEYYSEEADARVTIEAEGTTVRLVQKASSKFNLTPQYKDGFETPYGPLYFERNEQNKITGFKISISRARNVSFTKVK